MNFFSGFSLEAEEELFEFWLKDANEYCVAGFSYGAIKALEYAYNTTNRVDRLILLSPAFFNNKSDKYKRLQLLYFKKDSLAYCENFLSNVTNGYSNLEKYYKQGSYEELKELLYYNWNLSKLKVLQEKGVKIEVVLAGNDKIIDTKDAMSFFKQYSTIYYIKNANHMLRIKDD